MAPEKNLPKSPVRTFLLPKHPLLLNNMKFTVINAPGHTLGHVLYYLPDGKMLFTGDVLFNLCIGGLFEGTPQQMFATLQKIKALPDDTEIFPGHEYTRACLSPRFKETPDFAAYLQKMVQREHGEEGTRHPCRKKKSLSHLQAATLAGFMGME